MRVQNGSKVHPASALTPNQTFISPRNKNAMLKGCSGIWEIYQKNGEGIGRTHSGFVQGTNITMRSAYRQSLLGHC